MIRYELSPLSALAFRITDGSHNPPKVHSAGRVMLSAGCIQDGSINFNGRIVSQEDFEREHKRTQIKAGDVLLTIVGTVGRSAVVPLDAEPFIVQRSVAVIQPHSGIDPRFLSYQLRGPRVQSLLQSESRGVAQKGLYLGQLANIPVVLFPENEQRRIAEKLDELLSDLDAGVEALERARANLKRYRASVLKAAVEGKLTEQWRKEHPDVEPASKLLERILSERRRKWEEAHLAKYTAAGKTPPKDWKAKYCEPEKPDTADLELPEGWCWATMEQIGEVQLGRQRSPRNRSKDYPTKYLRAANITESGLDLSDVLDMEFTPSEKQNYLLHDGDLVLSEASGSPNQVGKPAIWKSELQECCFQNTVIRLRPSIVDLNAHLFIVLRAYYINGVFAKTATKSFATLTSLHCFSRSDAFFPGMRTPSDFAARGACSTSANNFLTSCATASNSRTTSLLTTTAKKPFEPATASFPALPPSRGPQSSSTASPKA